MLSVKPSPVALPWQWQQHNFRAMNTTVQTKLYSNQVANAAVLIDVERLFASFERQLSRFKPDSELSRLNAHPDEWFQASPTLLEALEVALLAAEATHGLYDPTILAALERAGYDRSFEKITPTDNASGEVVANAPARPGLGWRAIQLNRPRREIYRPLGLRLDLGGMGKGWSVDRAADRLQGLGPFLVNAGGDLYAYQSPPGTKGWEIDLVHPLKIDRFAAKVWLHHQALATSTIARRQWLRHGQLQHHLIDPRTGQPAQTDVLSVSVVADRTVTAEIYAKVALILGAEQGLAYLERVPGVEGLIFTTDSHILTTPGMAALLEQVEPAGYQL